jgi:hypothetical protein
LFGTNRRFEALSRSKLILRKASAMTNVVVAFLALFSASVFLAHAIEAYSTRKKHATVVQKSG